MIDNLIIGNLYTKKDLTTLIREPNLRNVREGVYKCKNSNHYLLFVTLDKSKKAPDKKYNDYFYDTNFHWDSQPRQHINTNIIQQIVANELTPVLFIRLFDKVKNITQPFHYAGRLRFSDYDPKTAKPVHIIFDAIDYIEDLDEAHPMQKIYRWKPMHSSVSTSVVPIMPNPKNPYNYKEPNITERKGLVTCRVAQGWYRNQLIEKWSSTCPVTYCDRIEILIASHIKRWSESSDFEKKDVDNGILLSPSIDALFDKYLVSFNDDGSLIISKEIRDDLPKLGISENAKIDINEGMKKYLAHHRKKFFDKHS